MKTRLLLFLSAAILMTGSSAQARIFIDITSSSKQNFPVAVTQPYAQGKSDPKNVEAAYLKRLYENLQLLGYFQMIRPKAFLENQKKKPFDTAQIDFSNWAVLDTLALIKSRYRFVSSNRVELTSRLYDVLLKSPILEKKYVGNLDQVNEMADRFANAVVEKLTGFEGFFLSEIAYICKKGKHKELCVMDFDGRNPRKLTDFNSITLSTAWNNSGSEIFFTSFAGGKRPGLYKHIANKRSNVPVSKSSGMIIGVDLHPKSQEFLTTLTKDGNSELYILDKAGRIDKRLTTNRGIDNSGTFSADGSQIAFNSDRTGQVHIYVMPATGGKAKQITFKGKHNTEPVFSPDGRGIIFAGEDTDGESDIFSVDIESKKITRLTYDSKDNVEPQISPGGHMIVFSSNRNGSYQLWGMNLDGSNQVKLSKSSWDHHMPSWGPNRK